jgi:hypothetical protein
MGNDLADYNNDGYIDIVSLDMLPDDEVVLKKSASEDAYNTYKLKLSLGFGRQFSKNALQLNLGLDENNVPSMDEQTFTTLLAHIESRYKYISIYIYVIFTCIYYRKRLCDESFWNKTLKWYVFSFLSFSKL